MTVRNLAFLPACLFALTGTITAAGAAESIPAPRDPAHTYAQHLVEKAAAAHADVVSLTVVATPPKASASVVVGSNAVASLGKPAAKEDLTVISSGATTAALDAAGDRYEVREPLKDVSGDTIGAIHVVFRHAKGGDTQRERAEAADIQTFFQKHVLSDNNLMDPYPYAAEFTPDTGAQALVDRTLAKYPQLLVLAAHVTLPDGRGNYILGSSIGRIGKKADEDDMRVINTGKSNFEVAENGKRYEVEQVLKDAKGQNIGALGTVFRYKPGDDKAALNALAEQIRDDMARQTPSAAALVAKAN